MPEYAGDHRQCDCCEMAKYTSQDISWNPKCVLCGKDLVNAKKGDFFK